MGRDAAAREAGRLVVAALLVALAQAGMIALAPALAEEARAGAAEVLGFVALGLLGGAAWFAAIGPLERLAGHVAPAAPGQVAPPAAAHAAPRVAGNVAPPAEAHSPPPADGHVAPLAAGHPADGHSAPAAPGRVPPPAAAAHLVLLVALAFGLGLRLAWLGTPVALDTDALRYLWDGGLAAHGVWPWAAPPAAGLPPGLGEAAAALHERLPFAELRTIYPGTAQAAFLLAHRIAPWEVLGLRLVMLGAELAALPLLAALLRRAGLPAIRVAVWWCCPLLPVAMTNAAHVDALLPPLLLGALLATLSARGMLAGLLLGLAAGVKLWPVLLAPLLARRLPRRAWAGAAAGFGLAAAATLGPLLATLAAPDAGLRAFAAGWAANNAPLAWAQAAFGPGVDGVVRPVLALAGAAVALAVAAGAPGGPAGLLRGALLVAAATFYLSPAQFPWYAAWFLPFAAALGCRALLLPAVLLPLYHAFFALRGLGLGAVFAHGIAAIHLTGVLLMLVLPRLGGRDASRPGGSR